jgi:hypothetical protein
VLREIAPGFANQQSNMRICRFIYFFLFLIKSFGIAAQTIDIQLKRLDSIIKVTDKYSVGEERVFIGEVLNRKYEAVLMPEGGVSEIRKVKITFADSKEEITSYIRSSQHWVIKADSFAIYKIAGEWFFLEYSKPDIIIKKNEEDVSNYNLLCEILLLMISIQKLSK